MISFGAAGCCLAGILLAAIDFTGFAHPPQGNTDYKTAKITSIVTLSIILIMYMYFIYSTKRWIQLTVGLPKYIAKRLRRNPNIPVRSYLIIVNFFQPIFVFLTKTISIFDNILLIFI